MRYRHFRYRGNLKLRTTQDLVWSSKIPVLKAEVFFNLIFSVTCIVIEKVSPRFCSELSDTWIQALSIPIHYTFNLLGQCTAMHRSSISVFILASLAIVFALHRYDTFSKIWFSTLPLISRSDVVHLLRDVDSTGNLLSEGTRKQGEGRHLSLEQGWSVPMAIDCISLFLSTKVPSNHLPSFHRYTEYHWDEVDIKTSTSHAVSVPV